LQLVLLVVTVDDSGTWRHCLQFEILVALDDISLLQMLTMLLALLEGKATEVAIAFISGLNFEYIKRNLRASFEFIYFKDSVSVLEQLQLLQLLQVLTICHTVTTARSTAVPAPYCHCLTTTAINLLIRM